MGRERKKEKKECGVWGKVSASGTGRSDSNWIDAVRGGSFPGRPIILMG